MLLNYKGFYHLFSQPLQNATFTLPKHYSCSNILFTLKANIKKTLLEPTL
jgi:hypothetical protein